MIIYIIITIFILYLINVIMHKLREYIIYMKNRWEHDKNSKECYDYCPNFAGKFCGRPGCPYNKK